MQNLVLFIQTDTYPYDISSKGANIWLNRFLIDEDAAFELSGVYETGTGY